MTGQDRRGRALTDREQAAVIAVGIATGALALLGFANSFAAVSAAAWPSFGRLAPTVPLGIDLGIAVFAALDLVLARLDMRPRWVRLVPWSLTAATVYLNTAAQAHWFGRVAHAVFPCLWVLAVEAGAHVIRIRAGLAAGTRMDRIRASRWMLAPRSTAALYRRMVLWEIRSYPDALDRERDRVLARTSLQDDWGALAWRWKAPRRLRALYRLGELAPAPLPAGSAPAADGEQRIREWLTGEPAPGAHPALHPAPGALPALNGHAAAAEAEFADELAAGEVPPLRSIQARMRIGQSRAQQVQAHLRALAGASGQTQ